MVRQRDISRREVRSKRADEEALFSHRLKLSQECAASAIARLKTALSDQDVISKLAGHKRTSIPDWLASTDCERVKSQTDPTVQFLVAWKFFYPLLSDADLAQTIDMRCPGLVQEMKDAFIAIIMDGPSQRTSSKAIGN